MARRPEFDRDTVVRLAMEVFWADGYHGASMSRLGSAMELRPGSIYAAFKSKEALFREALATYVDDIRHAASAESDPHRLLRAWFAAHIARSVDGQRGCLLLNTSTEFQRMDAESAAAVKAELETLEAFFARLVHRARPTPKEPTPLVTARLLVAALAGISTMSRAGFSKKALRDIADAALANV